MKAIFHLTLAWLIVIVTSELIHSDDDFMNSNAYKRSPVELLTQLAEEKGENDWLMLPPSPPGWLTFDNVIHLFKHVHDETPCRFAYNGLSSILISKKSTIGIEAQRMIRGFIAGGYPPLGPPKKMDVELLRQKVTQKYSDALKENIAKEPK
ncbi:MAG TPA: hypothetical protein QF564_07540 [Pirellulaceae bacterium]|jgi:hypothetical protein|nr:hypothetical protein [Pirellulaceae bacterium]